MVLEPNDHTEPRYESQAHADGQDLPREADEIAARIREFISRNFLFSENGFPYSDDASFLQDGVIDSLGVIELVPFLQKQFGISVADRELLPSNFDSVRKLTSFIARKQANGA
jgi:acyl carrier protein